MYRICIVGGGGCGTILYRELDGSLNMFLYNSHCWIPFLLGWKNPFSNFTKYFVLNGLWILYITAINLCLFNHVYVLQSKGILCDIWWKLISVKKKLKFFFRGWYMFGTHVIQIEIISVKWNCERLCSRFEG